MKFKDKLRNAWKKMKTAFAGDTPVNSMDAHDVAHIQKRVRDATPFDVAAMDTRMVNGRRDVGLIMPEDTPEAAAQAAEDVFIEAAKERGIELTRGQVLHYVPGTTTLPGRLVQPRPKTW